MSRLDTRQRLCSAFVQQYTYSKNLKDPEKFLKDQNERRMAEAKAKVVVSPTTVVQSEDTEEKQI